MASPTKARKEAAVTTKIDIAIAESVEEIKASLDTLRKKHGERKMVIALMVHNGGVLAKMLYCSGAGEKETKLMCRHLSEMTKLICDASQLDVQEIIQIAKGIDAQCAQLRADVIEAGKETMKEGG